MNTDKIFAIIILILFIGLITYFVIYWFGGQREADNAMDSTRRWTQNAIVVEKTNHWWGTSCLLNADDGNRYYDDSCYKYVNSDKVIIEMYKDYYRYIKGVI